MRIELTADGEYALFFREDEIPKGREIPGSCGHANLRLTSELLGRPTTEPQIASLIGVPQGEAVDNEYETALNLLGFVHSGWIQRSAQQCANILKHPGVVVAVNFMSGEDSDPDNNHYGIFGAVNGKVLAVADTQIKGSVSLMRIADFEELWHFLDEDKTKDQLCNWIIVAALTSEALESALAALESPTESPSPRLLVEQ